MSNLPFLFSSPLSPLGVLRSIFREEIAFLREHRKGVLQRKKNPSTDEEVIEDARKMLAIEEEFFDKPLTADERLKRLAEYTASERPAEEDANEQDLQEAERHIKGIETLLAAIKQDDIPAVITHLQIQIQDLQDGLMALGSMPEVMRTGDAGRTYSAMTHRRHCEVEFLTTFVKVLTAFK